MPARSGAQYLAGLRDDREVWLDGRRVPDVTTEPALAGAARTIAHLFDRQLQDPAVHLGPWPGTDDLVHVSHLIPRTPDDLTRRHRAIDDIARRTIGFLGRSPDYINVSLAGFAAMGERWAQNGNEAGAANLAAFREDCARGDRAMTHAIIHPTVDKSTDDVFAGGGDIVVHKVGETADGIVVRGARALATLAPFADEMFVYAGQPLPRGDVDRYALVFSVPMATPGLKVLCRDSYSSHPSGDHTADHFDHPFAHQFDEQDAIVIFDDVVVPHHRVFLDGDAELYNRSMQTLWTANVLQQTSIRAMVKLQFCHQLAVRMAELLGAKDATTNQLLGELWTYAELTRAAVAAAEAGARFYEGGAWLCDDRPFWALRPTLPRWFPRAFEIIKLLGSHNLLATPTRSELDNPELRPLIDKYYVAAGGDAEDRTRVFRAAWDLVGSGLGGRGELYERFYLASAARTYQMAQAIAARELRDGGTRLLDDFLTPPPLAAYPVPAPGSAAPTSASDGELPPRQRTPVR